MKKVITYTVGAALVALATSGLADIVTSHVGFKNSTGSTLTFVAQPHGSRCVRKPTEAWGAHTVKSKEEVRLRMRIERPFSCGDDGYMSFDVYKGENAKGTYLGWIRYW